MDNTEGSPCGPVETSRRRGEGWKVKSSIIRRPPPFD